VTDPVRIPADVDRDDRLLAGLTGRQLALLAAAGAVLYLVWLATRAVVPLPLFALGAVPAGTLAVAVVLGERDGVPLERLLTAAVRQRALPRRRVTAPEGVPGPPAWLAARATAEGDDGHRRRAPHGRPAPMRFPATGVGGGRVGVIDLGDDGAAVVAVASTVNVALRTAAEQEAIVAAFARYLHALTGPAQILVRAQPVEVSVLVRELRAAAVGLAHPALRAAASAHGAFLADLGERDRPQRHQVLLVLREPLAVAGPGGGFTARRGGRHADADARQAVGVRLARRLADATDLLAAAGIALTALSAGAATAVLAAACDPAGPLAPDGALAPAGDVITAPVVGGWLPESSGLVHDNLRDDEMPPGHRPSDGGALGRDRVDPVAFAPESVTVYPRHLRVGGAHVTTFAVAGYPREVRPGWLQPLLAHPGRVDVSLHVEPIDPVTAARRLRRQVARLESARRADAERGRLADPHTDVAADDAADLAGRVARGEGRLFRLGLYLTVHADSAAALADEARAVRAVAASLLLDARPVSYRSLQGWVSTLPLGLDQLRLRRTFDTAALSAAFPFTSPELPATGHAALSGAPGGVLYGRTLDGQGVVCWDRFDGLDNHNAVILGRSGAGKSYLVKLEALRSLYRGVEVHVLDPEDEYRRLADAVGGTCLPLGAAQARVNPFDLPVWTDATGLRTAPRDTLTRRSMFAQTVVAVMLGGPLGPPERAALDTALAEAYRRAGITGVPATWARPAPLLADVAAALTDAGDDVSIQLAARLRPYTDGAFAGLFSGPSTHRPEGHLVVYSLRGLADELRPAGTLLALDAVWRAVTDPDRRRPRLVVVDEAWWLMAQPAGAEFLFRMAKSARKHWAGLTVATQDAADVLGSELGRAVVANAATQILLRQAPQAVDDVTREFGLSGGERAFLLAARRGQGLLVAGTQRVAFEALASPAEDKLVTTSPELLATLDDSDDALGRVEL
jgi:hypothetical protein